MGTLVTAVRPAVVVWIDASGAVLVRWDGSARIDRLTSEIPARHAGTGHIRHDPRVRHGGGGPTEDGLARLRDERIREFLSLVESGIAPDEHVRILGPGELRDELARRLGAEDVRHGRDRLVTAEAASPLTERQLVALARAGAGDPPPRVVPRRSG